MKKIVKKGIATLSATAILSTAFASPALGANTYTVKSGDTLTKIAKNNETTIAKLKAINKLSSDTIFINQTLNVTIDKNTSTTTSASATTAKIEIKKASKTTYTVIAGDNLTKIANKHDITLAELQSLNKLTTTIIHPGDVLTVSKSAGTTVIDLPQAKKTSTADKTGDSTPTANKNGIYTIQKGDTLSKIAAQFGLVLQELKSLNQLTTDTIYAGQSLSVNPSVSKPADKINNTVPNVDKQTDTLISEAKKLLGTPYSWAGSSPGGFDCSGFVYYVMKKAGYSISRTSASTYFDLGKTTTNPGPGSLVFFAGNPQVKSIITHMGIYLGGGQFIHASTSKGVMISSLSSGYYETRLAGFKSF